MAKTATITTKVNLLLPTGQFKNCNIGGEFTIEGVPLDEIDATQKLVQEKVMAQLESMHEAMCELPSAMFSLSNV